MRRVPALALVGASVLALKVFVFSPRSGWAVDPAQSDSPRNDALRRAQVLRPARDPARMALGSNPPDLSSFGSDDLVSCRY